MRLAIGRRCRSHSAWLVGRERAECWHNLGVGLRQRKRSACRMQVGPLLCMRHPAVFTGISFPTHASVLVAARPIVSSNAMSRDALSDIAHTVRIVRCSSDGACRAHAVVGPIGHICAYGHVPQSNFPHGDAALSGSSSTGSIPDVATGTPERSGGTWMPLLAAPLKRGGHAGISAPWTHRWL